MCQREKHSTRAEREGMMRNKTYRKKTDACVAVVDFLERGQRFPGPVLVNSQQSSENGRGYGKIRVISGPEVADFFYDER